MNDYEGEVRERCACADHTPCSLTICTLSFLASSKSELA